MKKNRTGVVILKTIQVILKIQMYFGIWTRGDETGNFSCICPSAEDKLHWFGGNLQVNYASEGSILKIYQKMGDLRSKFLSLLAERVKI